MKTEKSKWNGTKELRLESEDKWRGKNTPKTIEHVGFKQKKEI